MKKFFYSTAIILSLFLTSSCEKDETEDLTTDPTGKSYELDFKAKALIQAETTANEMEFILQTVSKNRIQFPHGGTFLGAGAITRETNPNGLEFITLDFGTGAMCTDGKNRSGKLVVTIYPGGQNVRLNPENYKVDNSQVFGEYRTYLLLPENRMSFIVDGGAISKDGLNNIEFNLNSEVKQVEGASTTDIADDVFDRLYSSFDLHVTDNGKTVDLEASPLTPTAVSKLKYSCSNKYLPVTGQFKVKPTPGTNSLFEEFYLTFGNGNCGDKPFTQKTL